MQPNQNESLTSFSIHPDLLLSALDDASALVDRRRQVRATNARMERLFVSDDMARRIPFTCEGSRWRLGPSSRLDEPLQPILIGIEDVIAGARERFEAELGTDESILLAIACSIDGARGALVRIRLRTEEEEHRARCVEIVEAMQLGLYVFRLENEKDEGSLRYVYCNAAAESITHRPRTNLLGKLADEVSSAARAQGLLRTYMEVVTEKQSRDVDYILKHPITQKDVHYAIRAFPLSGQCVGSIFDDVTERREAHAALGREMALEENQAALLELVRQLSTPLLPIAEGVLVAPLVGRMDEGRGEHFIEVLLEGIQRHSAQVVLIDVTGVPAIDAAVAEQILRAARAARLLGTRTLLVGISRDVARTMMELGFDTTGLETHADLRAGIRAAQQGRRSKGEDRNLTRPKP
ncbi:MAG TPA: PAS domain-containing protein [Polyangium sp.]|nr:PAS domain-containing protein [Polyangium sp.]